MERFDGRREHLLGVAARVFASRGYDRTSMRDLSRAARMSLSGMYYYTLGKEDLLFQIQRSCFQSVHQGAMEAIAAAPHPEDRLGAFIRHHVSYFASHMAEMKVLAHEAESLTGRMLDEVRELKRSYVDLCARLLKDLDGRSDGRADRQVAAYALFGMMNWIYTWYDPDGPVDAERLADMITALFLNGYSAEVLAR